MIVNPLETRPKKTVRQGWTPASSLLALLRQWASLEELIVTCQRSRPQAEDIGGASASLLPRDPRNTKFFGCPKASGNPLKLV